MTDVFLSYAREDEARIRPLVKVLEDHGLSVFWDRRIPAGETWRSYIGHALVEAHCVLVAWSWSSVSSDWVIEEAEQARKRGVLLPFRLDPVDLPLGFGAFQAADLSDWTPGQPSPSFESFARDILKKVQEGRRQRGLSVRPLSGAVSSAPSSSSAAEAARVAPTAVGKAADLKPSKKPSAKPRAVARILVLVGLGAAAVVFMLSRLNDSEQLPAVGGRGPTRALQPDLAYGGYRLDPPNPLPGDPFMIEVGINNIGGAPSEACRVAIREEFRGKRRPPRQRPILPLEPSQPFVARFTEEVPTSGVLTIEGEIDPACDWFPENNRFSFDVRIR